MDDVTQWKYINGYRRLVNLGLVKDFTCHHCKTTAVIMLKDEEPVIKCFACNTTTYPNTAWWDILIAVVKEHSE